LGKILQKLKKLCYSTFIKETLGLDIKKQAILRASVILVREPTFLPKERINLAKEGTILPNERIILAKERTILANERIILRV
jgi:hypothetical protein